MNLAVSEPTTSKDLLWLRRLRDLSHRLAGERESRNLLPLIMDAAIELTDSERGFLVRFGPKGRSGRPKLRVEAARGFAKETLQGGLSKVSRTVVERVLQRKAGLVTSREEDQDLRNVTSIVRRRVLSILCVPLLLRGELKGVLYLDNRFNPEAFQETDLPIVMAFADQAALALETAELECELEAQNAELGNTLREIGKVKKARDVRTRSTSQPLPDAGDLPHLGLLIGASPAMQQLYVEIERAARSTAPVLVQGESGTGKELVARELHQRGPNPGEPFFAENCAAVADSLLESELFGHKKGAFTGATADREGLFKLAGGGTLFLDEVADMSPGMQAKLLRVLQDGKVRPVGADKLISVHCRVLVASLHDLRHRVDEDRFREDLYYRLDVLRVVVPPLRERVEDIPSLISHFLAREGRPGLELTPEALELLLAYRWPGNVRELENEVRRMVALGVERIGPSHISSEVRGVERSQLADHAYGAKTLIEVEGEMIRAALARCGGNKSQAARELGVAKTTLYRMMERHKLK